MTITHKLFGEVTPLYKKMDGNKLFVMVACQKGIVPVLVAPWALVWVTPFDQVKATVDALGTKPLKDITANKHRGNPQSVKANITAHPHKSCLRDQIEEFFRSKGKAGGIAEDALKAFPGKRYSSVTARISELRADKVLIQAGVSMTEYSGSEAAVLVHASFAEIPGISSHSLTPQRVR